MFKPLYHGGKFPNEISLSFFQQTEPDIPYELPPETIYMKCKALFPRKNKKKCSYHLPTFI